MMNMEPTPPPSPLGSDSCCASFGGVRLYLGDSLEMLPHLPKFDAVVTDPPYGIDWNTDYTRFTGDNKKCKGRKHRKVEGDDKPFDPRPWLLKMPVVLFGANCYASAIPIGSWLVWDKRFTNGKAFLADAEVAWMNRGHGVYLYAETCQGAVRKEPAEHPTQKPVGVMMWVMEKAKVAADATVLDPFMGSGSTGVAAVRTGRNFIGIEKDPHHFETARRRIEAEFNRHNQ
jgi:site-specific DNA-methyltransferase (adenine-specific)